VSDFERRVGFATPPWNDWLRVLRAPHRSVAASADRPIPSTAAPSSRCTSAVAPSGRSRASSGISGLPGKTLRVLAMTDRRARGRQAGPWGKIPGLGHWNSSSQTPHDHKLAPGAFVIHGSMKRSLLGFPSIVESNNQQTGLNPGVSLVPTTVEPLSGWCEKLNNLFTVRLMGSSFYSCIDC
jgi:hypothetical protein